MERWKEISEVPGYFISDQGRVKNRRGMIKKPLLTKRGYYQIQLSSKGINKNFALHRLVIQAFGQPQPPNTTVDHINRIKTDNTINNLRWATKIQQIENSVMFEPKGSLHPNSKLSENDIHIIRELLKLGYKQKHIAEIFKVEHPNISKIKNGKAWTHVKKK